MPIHHKQSHLFIQFLLKSVRIQFWLEYISSNVIIHSLKCLSDLYRIHITFLSFFFFFYLKVMNTYKNKTNMFNLVPKMNRVCFPLKFTTNTINLFKLPNAYVWNKLSSGLCLVNSWKSANRKESHISQGTIIR